MCSGEDTLVFMFTTNQSFIEWNVQAALVLGSGERISRTRLITLGMQVSPLVVNEKSFNITVQGSTPLVLTSMLTAPEPINDLNGTKVSCTAIEGSHEDAAKLSATIHIIEGGTCLFISVLVDIDLQKKPHLILFDIYMYTCYRSSESI